MGAALGMAFKALIGSLINIFSGWKVFLGFVVTGILAVVIYNGVVAIVEEVMVWVMGKISGMTGSDLPSGLVQLSGLAAWMAQQTYLDVQIGIAVSAISLKWLVVKIPFLKW